MDSYKRVCSIISCTVQVYQAHSIFYMYKDLVMAAKNEERCQHDFQNQQQYLHPYMSRLTVCPILKKSGNSAGVLLRERPPIPFIKVCCHNCTKFQHMKKDCPHKTEMMNTSATNKKS